MSHLETFRQHFGMEKNVLATSGKLENNRSVESCHFLVWQLDPGTASYYLSTVMAQDYIP